MDLRDDPEAEIARVEPLLKTAYPGRKIRVHLARSDAPVPFRAEEIGHRLASRKVLMSADVVEVRDIGESASTEAPVSVLITLSSKVPSPRISHHREPDISVGRAIQSIVAVSPMLFEKLKYWLDRFRESRFSTTKRPQNRKLGAPHPISPAQVQEFRREGASKRPAILIGFHWLEHGGAEKLAFQTVDWALEAGLRVIVVAAHNVQHSLAGRLPDHADVVFKRMDRYVPQVRTREFLRNLVLRENVQAIHIHHCPPLFEALPEIRAVAPDIHVISSTHILEYARGGYVYTSGHFAPYIDTQHVISRQIGQVLHDKFRLGDEIVLGRILEHDDARGETLPFTPTLANRALNILFVGRMHYQKRPVLAAMMMRALRDWARRQGVNLHFTIIGDGPYLGVFKGLLERYDLTGITTLHPANADVRAIMAQSDILLLPSANEGLALVCYEGVEAGVIPMSTDVGAQRELVPPELLLAREPGRALNEVVGLLDRLVNDAQFHQTAVDGLKSRYDAVTSDPTARDVLSEIYRRVATQGSER